MNKLNMKLYDSEYSSLVYRVLDRAGVEDKDLFLSQPVAGSFRGNDSIKDLERGLENIDRFAEKGHNFTILVDPDVDGFTSSALFVHFLNTFYPNLCIKPFFHNKHGIRDTDLLNDIISSETEVLILPDSSSNDFKEQKILYENGIQPIIIDHHLIDNELGIPKTTILINNQRSGQDINKNLTGAGMVLKFIYYYYKKKGLEDEFFNTTEYFNLAAIGQIGDVSDISDIEVRYIVEKGLSKIENSMFKTILEDTHGYLLDSDYDRLAPIDISFSINPLINSVARIGSEEEMELVFNAIVQTKDKELYPVNRKRKNRATGKLEDTLLYWTIQDLAYDYMKKIKRRQDKVSNGLRDKVLDNITTKGGVVVSILENTTDEENAVIGLSANKIANSLHKPTLLLRQNNGAWSGSGRNYKDTFDSFRDWCKDTELFSFAQGHDSAFGVGVPDDNLEKIVSLATDVKVKKDYKEYMVDYLAKDVDTNKVLEGYLSRWITGGKVDDILFGYEDIRINKKYISRNSSSTKLWDQGLEFIIFNDNGEIYDKIMETGGTYIRVDIVGEPKLNIWWKKEQLQIVVNDIAIRE